MVLRHLEYGPTAGETGRDGATAPVVLLGSIASDPDMWLPQLDALARDRRVIALNYHGHGGTPVPAGAPTDMSGVTAEVLATLDGLGVEDFDVVGLSLGGAIAQALAAGSPRVRRAAFLCTATSFGGAEKWNARAELTSAEGMAPMVDGVLDLWVTPTFRRDHAATTGRLRDMIAATDGAGYTAYARVLADFDSRGVLPEITCPVLTLAGSDDVSTPPAALAEIAGLVSGPVESVEVPGAHVPTVESPDEVTEALRNFLG
ncbi:alpha/beta fold hydrolase [Corynebacterium frankenforstense]|uniref:alpha/beta fold hydrolase n=1 Tax=Corynebacterium frankenforstense TaxID=1230998 RepID=UPI00254F5AB4|nr:alpha/beta fold hydrolase [Corynebacterium frankenforstense]MDK6259366.1 alpha/beta fold hydrolase [Corynebacterium frankenforstense]